MPAEGSANGAVALASVAILLAGCSESIGPPSPTPEPPVLFGGGDVSSGQLLDDTWEFSDASGWVQIR